MISLTSFNAYFVFFFFIFSPSVIPDEILQGNYVLVSYVFILPYCE